MMTMLSASNQHSYRAALSMNNVGVALLERGLYREGYKTLTESLFLVKHVFQGEQQKSLRFQQEHEEEQPVMDENDDQQEDQQECHDLTSEFLKAAAARMAGVSPKEQADGTTTAFDARNFVVADVTIVEDQDWCALRGAALYGPSTSVVFAVRISEETPESITQQFGVLLYNHGLAAFLLNRQHLVEHANNKSHKSNKKARSYLRKAQSSWQMADRTLDTILQRNDDDNGHIVSVVLLSALVLHALSVVYRQLQSPEEAEQAQAFGYALCQDLEEDGYCQHMLSMISTHTAAAA